jgi:signal transduction histidine kinase
MAHEIKNPLAGMSAALEVLAGEKELSPAAAEIMGEVLHQATRIRKIVDELLNYARPRPAQLILTDLNTTVEQSIPFAALQAQARGVKVQFKPVPLPPVLHDPEQIHRLVLNLLMNAIDASSAGSTVELSTARKSHGHAVSVSVSDHGCGIAEEDLARIFVPFYTTKGSRGTGLGLSLCRRIAELHDGSLTAVSTPGKGSRFTLTLPLKDAPVPETPSGAHLGQTKDPHRG